MWLFHDYLVVQACTYLYFGTHWIFSEYQQWIHARSSNRCWVDRNLLCQNQQWWRCFWGYFGDMEIWRLWRSVDSHYPVISVDLPYLSHVNHGGYKPLTKWDEPPSAFGLMASWGRNPVGVPWISLLRSRHFPDAANLRGGAGFAAATWVSKTGF